MSDLVGIPCIYMRGGTSTGPYFKAEDLPADIKIRDQVLLKGVALTDSQDSVSGSVTTKWEFRK